MPELRSIISGGESYSDDSMIASKNEANATAMMEISRLSHRKSALGEALKKANDIGICEDCGNDVPYKRYIINPATTLCTSCQEIREIKGKHVRQAA
ncbi:RNA polymerase-binding transcription factor DksA [compost metagenome]